MYNKTAPLRFVVCLVWPIAHSIIQRLAAGFVPGSLDPLLHRDWFTIGAIPLSSLIDIFSAKWKGSRSDACVDIEEVELVRARPGGAGVEMTAFWNRAGTPALCGFGRTDTTSESEGGGEGLVAGV